MEPHRRRRTTTPADTSSSEAWQDPHRPRLRISDSTSWTTTRVAVSMTSGPVPSARIPAARGIRPEGDDGQRRPVGTPGRQPRPEAGRCLRGCARLVDDDVVQVVIGAVVEEGEAADGYGGSEGAGGRPASGAADSTVVTAAADDVVPAAWGGGAAGLGGEQVAELGVGGHRWSSSSMARVVMARWRWLFTEPSATPRERAISGTVRSA